MGRFLNADEVECLGVNGDTSSYNLFAYCGNNPISRKDDKGTVWETAFDLITLGTSIVNVFMHPQDPLAWAGAVGDAIDLIPFVTGVGEAVKAAKLGKMLDKGGDAAKKVDFYVTPAGDAIPANMTQFNNNLSLMDNVNGKYLGETTSGPMRVRIEGPHPLDSNFNGDWDSDHFIEHIHIEHKKW